MQKPPPWCKKAREIYFKFKKVKKIGRKVFALQHHPEFKERLNWFFQPPLQGENKDFGKWRMKLVKQNLVGYWIAITDAMARAKANRIPLLPVCDEETHQMAQLLADIDSDAECPLLVQISKEEVVMVFNGDLDGCD